MTRHSTREALDRDAPARPSRSCESYRTYCRPSRAGEQPPPPAAAGAFATKMPANCVFGVMTVSEWGVANRDEPDQVATLGTYLAAVSGPKSLWPRFILALPVMLRCPTRHWGLRCISAIAVSRGREHGSASQECHTDGQQQW